VTDIKTQLADLANHVGGAGDQDLLVDAAAYIAKLERRQIPESWSSVDDGVKTEWSGLSGDGVLDVRGSKADIDVVTSWRQAKDRLAWFEEHYKTSQDREAELRAEVERLKTEADGEFVQAAVRVMRASPGFDARDYAQDGISADDFESFFTEDVGEAWRQVGELRARVEHLESECEALRTRYGRGR
jgi:hypothetical protein